MDKKRHQLLTLRRGRPEGQEHEPLVPKRHKGFVVLGRCVPEAFWQLSLAIAAGCMAYRDRLAAPRAKADRRHLQHKPTVLRVNRVQAHVAAGRALVSPDQDVIAGTDAAAAVLEAALVRMEKLAQKTCGLLP